MKEGWRVETIGDVCTLSTGGTPKRTEKKYFDGGKVKWLVSGDIHKREIHDCDGRISQLGLDNSNAKYLPKNSVMIALNGQGKTRGTVALLRTKATCNQSLVSIMPNDPKNLLPEYIFANLHGRYDEIRKLTGDSGNDRRGLNMPLIRKIKIPIAPLAEQKQIVSVLDEAFEGIDLALAAATKNLANARELFETTLNTTFTKKGEGWVETTLGEVCDVRDGTHDSPKYVSSGIPFVTQKNIRKEGLNFDNTKYISENDHAKFHKRSNVAEGDILISMIGANRGMSCLVNDQRVFSIKNVGLMKKSAKFNMAFLLFYLNSKRAKDYVESESRGGAQSFIGLLKLRTFPIFLPTLGTQDVLVRKLTDFWQQTQHLGALYQQKIDALTELKQSLLQKAFAGELTAANAIRAVEVADTQSAEFAANVIAFNFRQHEKAQQDKTYGRVKAQKGLHLVEAIGCIDMGRAPIKDAAGPNDSDHARSAENWAKTNQFFEFVMRPDDSGYDFVKLSKYNELLARAETSLAIFSDDIMKAIKPLVHKRTETAEVFTTVHAAWNNLIIDSDEITDEAIVTEAREDWHREKMKISRNKFFDAIDDIRQRGLEPTGEGKRVGEKQERLF